MAYPDTDYGICSYTSYTTVLKRAHHYPDAIESVHIPLLSDLLGCLSIRFSE
jgi:hypothetical protein